MSGLPPLSVVLDTNVVLDWLVFRDAACARLVAAIEAGHLHWIASTAMHDELAAVLARPLRRGLTVDAGGVLAAWQRWARPVAPAAVPGPLRCSDPDDQMFIDLALATGARWLLTRDRALLTLARRARELGLRVSRPGDWTADDSLA